MGCVPWSELVAAVILRQS